MSMKQAAVAAAAIALGLAAVPAEAHHSIQSVVDTGKVLEGEFVLTKVDWINPHSWFHFTVKDAKGNPSDVLIEWLSLSGLRQAGYATASAFTVGDTFKVDYNPNRDGSAGGNLVRMTDEVSGKVYDRRGEAAPPPPPPPAPQLRPGGVPRTNIGFTP
jgi:hypothetical protein